MTWQCLEAYLPKRQNHLESLGTTDEPALFVSRWVRTEDGAGSGRRTERGQTETIHFEDGAGSDRDYTLCITKCIVSV